jgi:hypothetical protein
MVIDRHFRLAASCSMLFASNQILSSTYVQKTKQHSQHRNMFSVWMIESGSCFLFRDSFLLSCSREPCWLTELDWHCSQLDWGPLVPETICWIHILFWLCDISARSCPLLKPLLRLQSWNEMFWDAMIWLAELWFTVLPWRFSKKSAGGDVGSLFVCLAYGNDPWPNSSVQ